ncbi:MAG: Fe-S cluster assembly protein SufD [Acidobacteriota bacterium]
MTSAIASIREEAAETFAKLGWPTTRVEEWRYTNMAPLQKITWRVDDAPAYVDSPSSLAGKAALELVFVNGQLVQRTGDTRFAEPGQSRIADWERNRMVALNYANEQDGGHIAIPANTILEGFIHLLFIGRGDGVWSHPRNVISVGSNAQVTLVETYVSTGNTFTNAVTEIEAADGAVVDHTKVQCESREAFHMGNIYIRQERGANVTSRSIAIGGAIARTETHVALSGEGASVSLDGLFVGTGTQHLDSLTSVDHIKPHCDSTQLYKGILDQQSRGIFDGRIIVRPDAQKTQSRQENRNLLLSETAIVDSKPNLEIHNDDVKCSHGSTIGQIDQEALFYLRSRGIAEDDARNLLVLAFAGEIVDRIRVEPVRELVNRALFQSLPERMPERRGDAR